MTTATAIDPDVLAVLQEAEVAEPDLVKLRQQLPRDLYRRVDLVLRRHGATWSRSRGGHVLGRAETILDHLVTTGGLRSRQSMGDFSTPPGLAAKMVALAGIAELPTTATILEPTAGRGALIRAVRAVRGDLSITAIEKDPLNVKLLHETFDGEATPVTIVEADFRRWTPTPDRWVNTPFSVLLANPPFHGSGYASILRRATTFLGRHALAMSIVPARLRSAAHEDQGSDDETWLWGRVQSSGRVIGPVLTTFGVETGSPITFDVLLVTWVAR